MARITLNMVYKEQPVSTYGFLAFFRSVIIWDSYSCYLTLSLINYTRCMHPFDD